MATTLMPLDPATTPQHATRLLPIAANLLPDEVISVRRARRMRSQVLAVLAAVAVLLGGWYAVAIYQATTAENDLEQAAGKAAVLMQQQNEFANVVATQNQSKMINDRLRTLLAEDLRWAGLLTSLRQTGARTGVTVTGMTGSLTSAEGNADNAETAARLPSATAERPVASLTVSGVARDKGDVAAYVEALGGIKQFANPYLTSATAVGRDVQFTVRIDVTSAALGGRYTPNKTNAQGGK